MIIETLMHTYLTHSPTVLDSIQVLVLISIASSDRLLHLDRLEQRCPPSVIRKLNCRIDIHAVLKHHFKHGKMAFLDGVVQDCPARIVLLKRARMLR